MQTSQNKEDLAEIDDAIKDMSFQYCDKKSNELFLCEACHKRYKVSAREHHLASNLHKNNSQKLKKSKKKWIDSQIFRNFYPNFFHHLQFCSCVHRKRFFIKFWKNFISYNEFFCYICKSFYFLKFFDIFKLHIYSIFALWFIVSKCF